MKKAYIKDNILCKSCMYPVVGVTYNGFSYEYNCTNKLCDNNTYVSDEDIIFIDTTQQEYKSIDIVKDADCDRYYALRGFTDGCDNKEYLINEHHCPMNIIPHIMEVYDNTVEPHLRMDSHGIFQYICSIPYKKDITEEDFINAINKI